MLRSDAVRAQRQARRSPRPASPVCFPIWISRPARPSQATPVHRLSAPNSGFLICGEPHAPRLRVHPMVQQPVRVRVVARECEDEPPLRRRVARCRGVDNSPDLPPRNRLRRRRARLLRAQPSPFGRSRITATGCSAPASARSKSTYSCIGFPLRVWPNS